MIVIQLPADSHARLWPHRKQSGWEVCEENQTLWLRLPEEDAAPAAALPCLARYRVDVRQRLVPLHGSVPVGLLPEGPWQSLDAFLTIAPPAAVLPGRQEERLGITLARSSCETEPTALLASLTDLASWAGSASRLRLARLTFAAAADGRVFVRGTPLPSVPGTPWYFQGNLALPAGWEFALPLRPSWVEQVLMLAAGSIALVDPGGGMEIIGQEGFAPLTLAALRRTTVALTSA